MNDLELLLAALKETTTGLGCSGCEPWDSIGTALESLTRNLEHAMSARHADLATEGRAYTEEDPF